MDTKTKNIREKNTDRKGKSALYIDNTIRIHLEKWKSMGVYTAKLFSVAGGEPSNQNMSHNLTQKFFLTGGYCISWIAAFGGVFGRHEVERLCENNKKSGGPAKIVLQNNEIWLEQLQQTVSGLEPQADDLCLKYLLSKSPGGFSFSYKETSYKYNYTRSRLNANKVILDFLCLISIKTPGVLIKVFDTFHKEKIFNIAIHFSKDLKRVGVFDPTLGFFQLKNQEHVLSLFIIELIVFWHAATEFEINAFFFSHSGNALFLDSSVSTSKKSPPRFSSAPPPLPLSAPPLLARNVPSVSRSTSSSSWTSVDLSDISGDETDI